jgi:hypothetical protein
MSRQDDEEDRASRTEATGPEAADPWEELGVRPELVATWQRIGFSAFEAALAQGDGFGPLFATGNRSQLETEAATWRQAGLDSLEGLRWHRAGFTAAEARRWQAADVGVEAAAQRAGHRQLG